MNEIIQNWGVGYIACGFFIATANLPKSIGAKIYFISMALLSWLAANRAPDRVYTVSVPDWPYWFALSGLVVAYVIMIVEVFGKFRDPEKEEEPASE